jgi:AcrR family transcriptional regulator
VLKAATKLFSTRGYAATSISAICKASGAVPSSIYWLFGNKAGVFSAVLEESAKGWLEQSRRSMARVVSDRPGSGMDRLNAYFDYMAEALTEDPEFIRLMLMTALERHHTDPSTLEIISSHRARGMEALAGLFADCGFEQPGPNGATAHEFARLTIALFDGAFAAAQIDADSTDVRHMLTLMRSAMTAALLPETEESQ